MAAAAPPPATGIPGASGYASADVLANNAYNNALAQINSQRLDTLGSYGYSGTVDPTSGVVSGVHVDQNSLYGQLQQLLHGQAVEDQQAAYAGQDRGFTGGLANQAVDALHYQHGAQDTQLGTGLEQALNALQQNQQGAAETRDNTLWQAEQSAADAAAQAQEAENIDQLTSTLGDPTAKQQQQAVSTANSVATNPGPRVPKPPRGDRAADRAARSAKSRILKNVHGRRR